MICSLNIMDLISSDYESFNILKNKMSMQKSLELFK